MAFVDKKLLSGQVGKTVSGLGLSKTAAMTLEVATGSITLHLTGVVSTLSSVQSNVFTSDSTYKKVVFIALIDNGSTVDVWFDEYVDDGLNKRGDVPSGYKIISDIAWFTIAVNETDLNNTSIYRREWL